MEILSTDWDKEDEVRNWGNWKENGWSAEIWFQASTFNTIQHDLILSFLLDFLIMLPFPRFFPAKLASVWFHEYANYTVSSGPLHLLFSLSGILFPKYPLDSLCDLLRIFFQIRFITEAFPSFPIHIPYSLLPYYLLVPWSQLSLSSFPTLLLSVYHSILLILYLVYFLSPSHKNRGFYLFLLNTVSSMPVIVSALRRCSRNTCWVN